MCPFYDRSTVSINQRKPFRRNLHIENFELVYEEDDLVVNKLKIFVKGSDASLKDDFISIWAVEESNILLSQADLFHLIATYDKGHKRIVSQGKQNEQLCPLVQYLQICRTPSQRY